MLYMETGASQFTIYHSQFTIYLKSHIAIAIVFIHLAALLFVL
jgi:hypothetical protein